MRWQQGRASDNVEDRRFVTPGRAAAGVSGLGLLIAVVIMLLGGDPQPFLNAQKQAAQQGAPAQAPGAGGLAPGQEDPQAEKKEFVTRVLGTTEDIWNDLFAQKGRKYEEPRLVLFTDVVDSACGRATASVGPFYCPGDHQVYIDLAFYDELRDKFGAPGDFAQAYVIAHEVGHHVQNLMGLSEKVQAAQRRAGSQAEANELSVRLELQADYLAGVWAYHGQKTFNFIEPGDVDQAIKTAKSIGDDRLQKQARGWASPESYTHGTSKQRTRYFTEGLKTGDATMGRLERFFTVPYDQRTGELAE